MLRGPWTVFICPSCGTLYPDLSTLCECELPNNIEGVETVRVEVAPVARVALDEKRHG
jgi:hypothetical protein